MPDDQRPAAAHVGLLARIASDMHDRLGPIRAACAAPIVAVLFAVVLTGVAGVLRMALMDPGSRFVTFYPAMALAALLGGPICGLTATVLGTVVVVHPIVAALGSIAPMPQPDALSVVSFLATGLIVTFVAAADFSAGTRDRLRSTRAIDESRAERRSIIAALHEGVLVFSSQGRLLLANPAAERILGRSEADLRAHDGFIGWDLLDEDGRALPVTEYAPVRVLYTGRPLHHQIVAMRVGDRIVWLLANAEPILDPDTGRVTAVVTSFTDITERRAFERDLAESRARLASIVETAMDAIISVDESQTVVLFNDAAERMFGCSAQEAIGLPLSTFIPARHHARHDAGFASFAAAPATSRIMGSGRLLAARRRDGSEFPIEASISCVDVGGRRLFTVIHRDITSRLAAEHATARLATIVTLAPTAIITADPAGTIDSWNAGATRLFGHTAEEAIGRPLSFLAHPGEPDDDHALFGRILQGGTASFEGVRRHADGSLVEVAWTAAAVRDADDRVIAVVAVMVDIGERRRQERLLHQREIEQRQTLDAAGLGVWWIDLDSGLVHADPRSSRLFDLDGVAPVSAVARHLHPDDRAAFTGLSETMTPGGASVALTLRAERPDSPLAWLHLTARLRVSDGGGAEIWGTVQDITEQRNAERALKQIEANRRVEALGRMTGGIAHDFNNLLTVISGNLQLLETTTEDPAATRWIAEALRATETGAALNHRLSTFARQRRLEPVVTDLDRRIDAMIDLLHRSVGPNISIVARFGDAPWPVRIDPAEIEHALLNLVFNARDAMPDGGRIVIETTNVVLDHADVPDDPARHTGPHVRLSVSDTGCGMTAEVRARAFEPFFTTKESGRGSGLGLATLHGFARQSGGFVTLYSEVGHGTTVNLYLPHAEATATDRPTEPRSPMQRGNGETILLVEDNPDVARVTRDRLAACGWRVEEAVDARAALAFLASGRTVDLVFSDIMMPGGLSGIDLARRLRAEDPHRRILLTSGFSEEIARGDRAGPLEFPILRKPYSYADLVRSISDALAGDGDQPRTTSAAKT